MITDLSDDYSLDTLMPGVYRCYCTIWNVRARYIIKNIAIQASHYYYRQIAVPYMGDSYVFIRYTKYDNNNNIVWTDWTPIDAFSYLQNKITALDQKFTNNVNEGRVSNCNQAPDGVSYVINTTSNKPNNTNYGVLVQFTSGNGNNPCKVQFLSEYVTNKLYVRNDFNGEWTNWLEK